MLDLSLYTKKTKSISIIGIGMELFWLALYCIPALWPDPRMPISLPQNLQIAAIAFIVLCLLYGIGYRIVQRLNDLETKKIVVHWAIIFCLTLLFIPFPLIGSADILNYIMTGRVMSVHHENPYLYSTMMFQDPNLEFEMYGYTHGLELVYGPLWALISLAITWLGKSSIFLSMFLFQCLSMAASLGCILMVGKIAKKLSPKLETMAIFLLAWNPLWLFETIHNAHNESIMIFLFLCSLYFLMRKSWNRAFVFLALSCLIKYIYVLAFPFFLWYGASRKKGFRNKIIFLLKHCSIIMILVCVFYIPFWQGPETLQGLEKQSMLVGIIGIFPPLKLFLYTMLSAFTGQNDFALIVITRKISMFIFCAVYSCIFLRAILFSKKFTFDQCCKAVIWAISIFMLLVPSLFNNWYALWVIPIALVLRDNKREKLFIVLTLTASSLFAYIVARNNASIPLIIVFAASLPVYLYFRFINKQAVLSQS